MQVGKKESVVRKRLKVLKAEFRCHSWNNAFRSAKGDGFQHTGRVISLKK